MFLATLLSKHAPAASPAALAAALAVLLAAGPLPARQADLAGPAATEQDEAVEPLDQYRVELIVFEYSDALAGTTEDWSAPAERTPQGEETTAGEVDADDGSSGQPGVSASAEAADGGEDRYSAGGAAADATGGIGEIDAMQATGNAATDETEEPVFRFMPLAEEELELGDLYRRLRNADGYEPLVHVAWQQPGYEPEDARPLDLARLAELPARLRGEARLYRSRFLHLALDLELMSAPRQGLVAPVTAVPSSGEGERLAALEPDVYRLIERRKLRSGELHYYDHPRYGVLAKVTPVEVDEAGAAPAQPEAEGGGESGTTEQTTPATG